nr:MULTISPECIES: fumarylacetoacetate hydrolase family protein [unclassified Mycolicibacterium]
MESHRRKDSMKLATFSQDGISPPRVGAVLDTELVDLGALACDVPAFFDADLRIAADQIVRSGANRIPLSEVTFRAPVVPSHFFAIGLNYADHAAESGIEKPEDLVVFLKASSTVVAHQDPIERPLVSKCLDYEGELAVVIGQRCRHVSAADAAAVIGGYTIANDVSVRDWQTRTSQWALGKSFDTHGPIGPWIVTPDEVADPHDLDLRTYVNGELRQSSNTSNLIFDCYRIIETLSQVCMLLPGDVIATGTPSGGAFGMKGEPWLVPGDVVRVEIERLGALENTVVDETPQSSAHAGPVRDARR